MAKRQYAISSTLRRSREDIEVEVAFQFVNEFEENILGFCNNIYTQEGERILQALRPSLQ